MRIFEGVNELGPYPSVDPEMLNNIPPSIDGGLRDSIVCNPCNGPMYWEGEIEHWACPTCPNRKTLIKRVTSKERAEQLGLGQVPTNPRRATGFWIGMAVVAVIGYLAWTESLETRVRKRRATSRKVTYG